MNQTYTFNGVDVNFDIDQWLSQAKGYTRDQMPQVDMCQFLAILPDFIKYAKISEVMVSANELKPTQSEINFDKVLTNVAKLQQLPDDMLQFICCKDFHVVDGHHRLLECVITQPERLVKCYQFDLDIVQLIDLLKSMTNILSQPKDITDKVISEMLQIFEDYGMQGPEAVPGMGVVSMGEPKTAETEGTKGSGDFPSGGGLTINSLGKSGCKIMTVSELRKFNRKLKLSMTEELKKVCQDDEVCEQIVESIMIMCTQSQDEMHFNIDALQLLTEAAADALFANETLIGSDSLTWKDKMLQFVDKILSPNQPKEVRAREVIKRMLDNASDVEPTNESFVEMLENVDSLMITEELNEKQLTEYKILCRDQDKTLFNLIEHIRVLGNTGHSFSIVVDPDATKEEGKKTFGWDGDGSDYLQSIELIREPVKEELASEKNSSHLKHERHFDNADGLEMLTCINKPVQRKCLKIDEPFSCKTIEGVTQGVAGSYLMLSVDNEIYPCDAEIFDKTYLIIDELTEKKE